MNELPYRAWRRARTLTFHIQRAPARFHERRNRRSRRRRTTQRTSDLITFSRALVEYDTTCTQHQNIQDDAVRADRRFADNADVI